MDTMVVVEQFIGLQAAVKGDGGWGFEIKTEKPEKSESKNNAKNN